MANNYYNMTGVLVLDKVTPVIKAFLGVFDLDGSYPGNGEAYIANISESTSCSWDSILENVQELVKELGLKLSNPEGEDGESEDNMENNLYALATHFGADDNEELHNLIERITFEDDADLDALFTIAKAFNDGHGLKAYKTEASWHCSKPRLFEFGGFGQYTGLHVSVSGATNQPVILGEELESALSSGNTNAASDAIMKTVVNLLNGIYDEAIRNEIQLKLSDSLGEIETTVELSADCQKG